MPSSQASAPYSWHERFEPTVFLPLLYLVYFALANILVLYIGTLISAFVSHQRLRSAAGIRTRRRVGSAVVPVVVMVTYPLWTEPVAAPWLIVPIGSGRRCTAWRWSSSRRRNRTREERRHDAALAPHVALSRWPSR